MPQISTIHYKDIQEAQRFDAEYFKPEYLEIERKFQYEKSLEDFSASVVCGPFGSTILNETYQKTGIEVVRPFNIKDGKIEDDNLVYISKGDVAKKGLKVFHEGDLFFARVGDIGVGVLTHEQATVSPNIIAVKMKRNLINPYFLSTFFNTRFGTLQIEKGLKVVAQPTISTGLVKKLKVPSVPIQFQNQVESVVKLSYQCQTQSKRLYQEAEELLLQELGLIGHEVRHTLAFSTTKRGVDAAGRIDAEYFQPKYQEIIDKIEAYPGGWASVGDCVRFNDQNYFPNIPPRAEKLHKYIALSNVSSLGYIQDYQEELGKNLPSRARRRVHAGEVIISSIEGSLSSCALVESEFDGAICSTGFFVLKSDQLNSETLLLLFKSNIIQELLARGSKGTILTAISKSELKTIKLPLIRKEIQEQIAEKITESCRLRKERKELLERAKLMVEKEIEKE